MFSSDESSGAVSDEAAPLVPTIRKVTGSIMRALDGPSAAYVHTAFHQDGLVPRLSELKRVFEKGVIRDWMDELPTENADEAYVTPTRLLWQTAPRRAAGKRGAIMRRAGSL